MRFQWIKELFAKPTNCLRCNQKTLQTNSVCLRCYTKDIKNSKTNKEALDKLLFGIGKQQTFEGVKQ